jgi:hypothetical protein
MKLELKLNKIIVIETSVKEKDIYLVFWKRIRKGLLG